MPLDKPRYFRENKKKQKEFDHWLGVCAISCACFCFFIPCWTVFELSFFYVRLVYEKIHFIF